MCINEIKEQSVEVRLMRSTSNVWVVWNGPLKFGAVAGDKAAERVKAVRACIWKLASVKPADTLKRPQDDFQQCLWMTDAGYFWQDVGPSASVLVMTKTGILSQNIIFYLTQTIGFVLGLTKYKHSIVRRETLKI